MDRKPLAILGMIAVMTAAVIVALSALTRAPDPAHGQPMASPDVAIATLDAAIARSPNAPPLYVERGRWIMRIYEWDRALADFDRALALDAAYAEAYYWRGLLYASAPSSDARPLALADFRRYLALDPGGAHSAQAAEYVRMLQAALAPAPPTHD